MADARRTTVITGASSGIGAALARASAGPAARLYLCARDEARLAPVAEDVRSRGAEVFTAAVDVRDHDRLRGWLEDADARHPVDRLIANAGVSAGLAPGRHRERDADVDRMIATNLSAAIHTVGAVVEQMRSRKRGEIVLIASLAGLQPLADMPTYSAVKAGIVAYGRSIRVWLAADRVSVTVICPGFVTSAMSARHKGAKPFEISADKAARLILRAVDRRVALYAFPWQLALPIALARLSPQWIVDRIESGFSAEVEPDPRADL